MTVKCVGVFPQEEFDKRRTFFQILELVFPLRFEGRGEGEWPGLDAGIFLQGMSGMVSEAARQGLFCYVAISAESGPGKGRPREVRFTASESLDSRLRNKVLTEKKALEFPPLPVESGDAVRAEVEGRPVWIARRNGALRMDLVPHAPREIAEGEGLRDQIAEGEFIALLPLVHFLREVAGEECWRNPPLRGSIILDDPNLHWSSYGFARYAELARHAEEHHYHISMAMIPFDGWFAHRGARRVFREQAARISLIMHGNNHTYEEFMQPMPREACDSYIAQALRRVETFERRWGVPVGRVMVAPHGRSSLEMLRAMLTAGIEAMISDVPHPWRPMDSRNPPEMPTARWEPAEMVVGGFPIIPRFCMLSYPYDEIILRGFLDLPLIFAGHQWDLAWGLDILTERAEQTNSLGPVRWMSPAEIARTNYATRRRGGTLQIKLYSRRVRVSIPEGVNAIEVTTPPVHGESVDELLFCGERGEAFHYTTASGEAGPFPRGRSQLIPVPEAGELDIQLTRPPLLDKPYVPPPFPGVWIMTRRILTEGRDHLLPYLPKTYRQNYAKERIQRMLCGRPVRSKYIG
ncbi:MAG: hypothetical protein ACE15F_12415 [bacterium]